MTVEELNVKVTADISDLKRDLGRMEKAVKGSAKKSEGAMSGGMKKIGGAIAAAFSVQAIIGFSRAVIEVRSEFEKFEAVLTNTLGSSGAAKLALLDIKEMAARTPFSVAELSGAFVKLTNYGLQPSMEAMRQYGDLASSVGKGFDQLAEAVADATTGEFERLKEFGIKTKKEGDKVTFTFKEQATTVDFTTKAIENYVKGLGDVGGVSGSMAAISETLGGKVSNLGDKWDSLLNTVGNTDVWGDAVDAMGEALSRTEKLFKVANDLSKGRGIYGTFDAYREAYMLALYDLVGVDWLDESVKKIDEASKKAAESLARGQRMANERRGAGLPGVGPLPQGSKTPSVFGPTGLPFKKVGKSADDLAKELAKATEEASKLRKARVEELGLQKSMQQATQLGQRQMGTFNLRLRGQMDTGGFVKPTITGPEIQYEDTSNLVLSQLQERTFEADEAMFDFGSSASILSQSLVAAAQDTENATDIFINAFGAIVTEITSQLLAKQLGSFAGPVGGLVGGLLSVGIKGRDLETSRSRTRNTVTRFN
tara:strand:+ start:1450 stop:3066 length:1617 start_codon:yes stop_codon:yes gene_type:complete